MKCPTPNGTTEIRVARKYRKLYTCLMDFITALETLESGGVALDDVVAHKTKERRLELVYVATPIQLTVATEKRQFVL